MKNRSVEWRIHSTSPAEKLFRIIDNDEGRSRFWTENSEEIDGHIHFQFPNGQAYKCRIVERIFLEKFSCIYFDSLATFLLSEAKNGTTDVTILHKDIPKIDYEDTLAG